MSAAPLRSPTLRPHRMKKEESFLGKLGGTLARKKKAKEGEFAGSGEGRNVLGAGVTRGRSAVPARPIPSRPVPSCSSAGAAAESPSRALFGGPAKGPCPPSRATTRLGTGVGGGRSDGERLAGMGETGIMGDGWQRWGAADSSGGRLAAMGETEVMEDGTSAHVACPGR